MNSKPRELAHTAQHIMAVAHMLALIFRCSKQLNIAVMRTPNSKSHLSFGINLVGARIP